MKPLWKGHLRWVCFGFLLLGGCISVETLPGPLTANDEAAIYKVVVQKISPDDHVVASEVNRWEPGFGPDRSECDQTEAFRVMPILEAEVIPAFCSLIRTSRPLTPEVINLLGLEVHDPDVPTQKGMVRLSSIQSNSQQTQALVFAERRDGRFVYGAYFLLINHNGTWTVLYEVLAYIS